MKKIILTFVVSALIGYAFGRFDKSHKRTLYVIDNTFHVRINCYSEENTNEFVVEYTTNGIFWDRIKDVTDLSYADLTPNMFVFTGNKQQAINFAKRFTNESIVERYNDSVQKSFDFIKHRIDVKHAKEKAAKKVIIKKEQQQCCVTKTII